MKQNKKMIIRRLYNETSQFYEARYSVLQWEKYKAVSSFLFNYLANFLNIYDSRGNSKQVLKIVDVGCGTGLFFKYIKKFFPTFFMSELASYKNISDTIITIKYIGIDLANKMLNIALKKKDDNYQYFLLANAEVLPLRDNISNITVSFTVIQNLDNPLEMIHELIRITDTQGLVILSALKKSLNEHFFRENIVNAYNKIISSFKILELGREDIGIIFSILKP